MSPLILSLLMQKLPSIKSLHSVHHRAFNMAIALFMIAVLSLLVRGLIGYASGEIILEKYGFGIMVISAFLSSFIVKYLSICGTCRLSNIMIIGVLAIYVSGATMFMYANVDVISFIILSMSILNYLPFIPKKLSSKISKTQRYVIIFAYILMSIFIILLFIDDDIFDYFESISVLSSSILVSIFNIKKSSNIQLGRCIIIMILIITLTFIFTYSVANIKSENNVENVALFYMALSNLLLNSVLPLYKKIHNINSAK